MMWNFFSDDKKITLRDFLKIPFLRVTQDLKEARIAVGSNQKNYLGIEHLERPLIIHVKMIQMLNT